MVAQLPGLVRTANPNPQAHKGLPQMSNERFQPIVAAITAGGPEPKPSQRERNIIHRDQDLFGLDFEILGERTDDLSSPVHITKRLNQQDVPPFSQFGAPSCRSRKCHSLFSREIIDYHETNIVPRTAIL